MIEQSEQEKIEIDSWVKSYFASSNSKPVLITALLALQERFGYLPKTGLDLVAKNLGMSPASAYGVATFYNQFRFVPPGKYAIKVCVGTACHIKQAGKILDHWQRELGINAGEVSEDREYSLDRVACVGCCTLAPVTVINDEVVGYTSPTKIDGILLKHKMDRDREQDKDKDLEKTESKS